jgi:hypothetical protein
MNRGWKLACSVIFLTIFLATDLWAQQPDSPRQGNPSNGPRSETPTGGPADRELDGWKGCVRWCTANVGGDRAQASCIDGCNQLYMETFA